MFLERIICGLLLVLVMMTAGCAGRDGRGPRFIAFSGQERTLNEARDLLRAGNVQQTRSLLEKVVEGEPTAGVSDEALFRLALLSLNEDGSKGFQHSQALLEKLAVNYPDSLWTRQSAPLLSHLADYRVLRTKQRELKALKELNYSLSRDNKEMRQSLEQLKRLDLELEQRIKR